MWEIIFGNLLSTASRVVINAVLNAAKLLNCCIFIFKDWCGTIIGLFIRSYEVVSIGTAMGHADLTSTSLKIASAARHQRVKTVLCVPAKLSLSGTHAYIRTGAQVASLAVSLSEPLVPLDLRFSAGRKNTYVEQNAYRCLPPGGNARRCGARQ